MAKKHNKSIVDCAPTSDADIARFGAIFLNLVRNIVFWTAALDDALDELFFNVYQRCGAVATGDGSYTDAVIIGETVVYTEYIPGVPGRWVAKTMPWNEYEPNIPYNVIGKAMQSLMLTCGHYCETGESVVPGNSEENQLEILVELESSLPAGFTVDTINDEDGDLSGIEIDGDGRHYRFSTIY